jgi:hypothetical protein
MEKTRLATAEVDTKRRFRNAAEVDTKRRFRNAAAPARGSRQEDVGPSRLRNSSEDEQI